MLSLDLKLDTKEGTAHCRTHLHIFIKFIKKITEKKDWIAEIKKMSKAIEENKWRVMIKRPVWEFNLYWKFMRADKNNYKNKTNLPIPPFQSFS